MQNSEGQANHLQILAAGGGGDVSRLGADIVDDGLLQPGNEEMCAFIHDRLLNTAETIEDDRPGTTFDVVDGRLAEGEADENWHCPLGDGVEDIGRGHGDRFEIRKILSGDVFDRRGGCGDTNGRFSRLVD